MTTYARSPHDHLLVSRGDVVDEDSESLDPYVEQDDMTSPSHIPFPPSPPLRPPPRPSIIRESTTLTVRQSDADPFLDGSTISVSQPVGSLSISPSSRDVCLASRKGLYILDLANLNNAPRFIPQGGTWQIAE